MTVVLDSGGVSALAADRALVDALVRRGQWPPEVPTAVLTESVTGDARRDHAVNRLLSVSMLHDIDEALARRAARLRAQALKARAVSGVDALVVALAERWPDSQVVTSDPEYIGALADCAERRILTVRV